MVGVLAGANRNRSWPDFFERGFDTPVRRLASPGFVFSRQRGVNLPATLWQVAMRLGEFRESLRILSRTVNATRPDLLVNFLEPLVGWFARIGRSPVPMLAVGHQFMLSHPDYGRSNRCRLQQWGLRRYVETTGAGAMRYALSFYRAGDDEQRRCLVGPPLLRDELFHLETTTGEFLLVYLLNEGYRRDLESWHRRHPGVPIHCFYDRPNAPETERVDATLTFHALHGERFLEMMAACRGVVCTAGFESVSEAAWLGKPVLAVPVEGHVEQMLNAVDAEHCGLALAGQGFELDRLLEAPLKRPAQNRFREWMRESDERLAWAVARAAPAAAGPLLVYP